jgi:hypothetical protein
VLLGNHDHPVVEDVLQHATGPPGREVVELEAPEASELVTTGRAEYVRDAGIERAVTAEPETTTPIRRRRRTPR